jgi:N utilization substance protein B
MSTARNIRRCAIQALYQFDAGNETAPDIVLDSLSESPGDANDHSQGLALAERAWKARTDADAAVAALTPEWPTYRQPVVDRCILRLAHYEMRSGETPPKVAINEAVELAKEFSTEKSPSFINGVLDKVFKAMKIAQSDCPADQTSKRDGSLQ